MTRATPDRTASFWAIAASRSVVRRASGIALVVGAVLALINHGGRLSADEVDGATLVRILLTFCVPYCVSTYSSVLAVRDRMQRL